MGGGGVYGVPENQAGVPSEADSRVCLWQISEGMMYGMQPILVP